jgi:large subunit ribosomal protein L13
MVPGWQLSNWYKSMKQDQTRKIHTIDATNKRLGRLAVEVAVLLRGKNKPEFVLYKDVGDFVEIKNIENLEFTGRKLEQKTYYRHSGYLGSLKERKLGTFFKDRPSEVLRKAVWGMLPKNKLRSDQINRLTVE